MPAADLGESRSPAKAGVRARGGASACLGSAGCLKSRANASARATWLWLTYRQAQSLGAQVRRGERGVLCAHFERRARERRGDADDVLSQDGGTRRRGCGCRCPCRRAAVPAVLAV
ncbi:MULTISPECIES: ArdC family protein [unclassified Variovorax]|uniref:ArdC family protein n=1 Tax=unclassified Variovorax TaxID=663243 RepID=UPI00210B2E65|nr:MULTISPECIES: ArdC family protein [unclassified Variovorax]